MDKTKSHKTILVVLVILVLIGILYIFALRKPNVANSQDVAMENIKDLIINKMDCADALPQLSKLIKTSLSYAPAWHWQGVCQFQTGDLVDANTSFEKALSLDGSDTAAKNYLKIISTIPANTTITTDNKTTMTEKQFESALGFTPNPAQFSFIRLVVVPTGTSTESVAGFYKSVLSESATKDYFNSEFKKIGLTGDSVTTQTSGGIAGSAITVYAIVMFTKTK